MRSRHSCPNQTNPHSNNLPETDDTGCVLKPCGFLDSFSVLKCGLRRQFSKFFFFTSIDLLTQPHLTYEEMQYQSLNTREYYAQVH